MLKMSRYAIIMIIGAWCLFSCRHAPLGKPVAETYERLDRPEVFLVPPVSRSRAAGLMPEDIVLEYNGSPVRTYHELLSAESASAGKSVPMVILRDDRETTLVAEAGPLGFVPLQFRYCGSLALALEAILTSFGRTVPYSWLAALTGESFSLSGRPGDWWSWWPGDGSADYLGEIAEIVGLRLSKVYEGGSELPNDSGVSIIQRELRLGQPLLALARWGNSRRAHWGIISGTGDNSHAIQAYSIGSAAPQPLTGEILVVYSVRPIGTPEPEPAAVLATALDHALELGLATAEAETGWRSGLDAYDALIAGLDTAPPTEILSAWQEQFDRLIWALIGCKQTACAFLEEMREALADETDLLDETISAHRTIVSKLEGLLQSGLGLGSSDSRRRIQLVLNEIQLIENDLLGFYEDIIGEL